MFKFKLNNTDHNTDQSSSSQPDQGFSFKQTLALLILWLCSSQVAAGACQQQPQLCQQRDHLRPVLSSLFNAAADSTLSWGEYLRLREAHQQADEVAQQMQRYGSGYGFYYKYVIPAADLVMRSEDPDHPLGGIHIEADAAMAARSDRRYASGQSLAMAEHYLRSKRQNWSSYKHDNLRYNTLTHEQLAQVRSAIISLLMSQPLQCEYANALTRVYSPYFNISGYGAGDLTSACRSAPYIAAKTLLDSIP